MKNIGNIAAAVIWAAMVLPHLAVAQTASEPPPSITTPDKVESRLGTLDFKDGAPSKATLEKVYDDIDFTNAQRAFADTFRGVSIHAIRKGLQSVGVKDNDGHHFLRFDGCQVVVADHQRRHDLCRWSALDLTKWPMVLETAPGVLGAI